MPKNSHFSHSISLLSDLYARLGAETITSRRGQLPLGLHWGKGEPEQLGERSSGEESSKRDFPKLTSPLLSPLNTAAFLRVTSVTARYRPSTGRRKWWWRRGDTRGDNDWRLQGKSVRYFHHEHREPTADVHLLPAPHSNWTKLAATSQPSLYLPP